MRPALLVLALVTACGQTPQSESAGHEVEADPGWSLVWADEFNGSGPPDAASWSYHVGNGSNEGAFIGWGNGEWEWYRPENCVQTGGNLELRAEYLTSPMAIGGRSWFQRSCRITSQGKRSWTYGRIEARIAIPNAPGSWPAFWMLGDSSGGSATGSSRPPPEHFDVMANRWASCGEVDIMEHRNSEQTIVNNIFWDRRSGVFPWAGDQNANYEARPIVGDVSTFHVYAIEWDRTFMRWFVDGRQTHVIDITPATLEEFHKPFYLILNLALGGQFPGVNPDPAHVPTPMKVDYVRVFQRRTGAPPAAPAPEMPAPAGPAGFTRLSPTSIRFVVNDAPWADLHYVNGGQQNVRMLHEADGTNHFTVSELPAGASVKFFFTIGRAVGADDTAWSEAR